jgi:hypothetical protein
MNPFHTLFILFQDSLLTYFPIQRLERWRVCPPLSVNVFVTLATQQHWNTIVKVFLKHSALINFWKGVKFMGILYRKKNLYYGIPMLLQMYSVLQEYSLTWICLILYVPKFVCALLSKWARNITPLLYIVAWFGYAPTKDLYIVHKEEFPITCCMCDKYTWQKRSLFLGDKAALSSDKFHKDLEGKG